MDYVKYNATVRPTKLAIRDLAHNLVLSYSEFEDLVARCATFLLDRGVVAGERVACLSRNRAEMIILHLACARTGMIFVPLNWRLSEAEIYGLLDDCQPRLLVADQLAKALGIEYFNIDELLEQASALSPYQSEPVSIDTPSLMLYTSGTTGRPKGAMLTERNIGETALNFALLGQVSIGSVFLCESPMFHVIGLVTSVRAPIMLGGTLLISDAFVPERTLERLGDPTLGVSHYFCVPQMALSLRTQHAYDPSQLKYLKALFTGGAPHSAARIMEWVHDGIPIVDGYGSTECGTVFGMPLDLDIIAAKAGSVGVPTPRVQARIVGPTGIPLATGESGELQIRGPNMTVGYWGRDEDYREAVTEDGWFRSGDIARIDKDGYFYIVDRKKDMFISGGENVYPAEIEALLVRYPGIKEVAVIGIPDEKWGEVGCVFYVSDTSEVTAVELSEFLSGKLARYKIPKVTQRIAELPRNSAGKLLKSSLRLQYRDNKEVSVA
ncbi:AMP-binding protein [Microbulbifer pacificus]|uniref:AMP-binding protein n=1 Tax=Microbulbifer pacificus TaxID=407164 RepID=A0AAU0N432_9GAMM|nr:AMP-binding protein [Microbulbifer pacificus]WOX07020.1 AMP-binding protein [Microbulbifer pacificus]